MIATLIDGKGVASRLEADVASVIRRSGRMPGLVVIRVGDDPASEIYVARKKALSLALGMDGAVIHLPAHTSQADLMRTISQQNHLSHVHGILLQLPLPRGLNAQQAIESIAPEKDVDGIHPLNLGRLMVNDPTFIPCTPQGCLRLLQAYNVSCAGKHAVVVGRSRIVGMPLATLLTHQDATVTLAHSHTQNLEALCQTADILISAVGNPRFITADMVKPDATVIDVGITRHHNADGSTSLYGDVDFETVRLVAGLITPVPGGVGPMTVACLMYNTLKACLLQNGHTLHDYLPQPL